MKKCVLFLLMAFAFTVFCAEPPIVKAAASAPMIDGKLDDACWADALKFDKFQKLNTRHKSDLKTEVFLAYDSTGIYAAFKCFKPKGGSFTLRPDKGAYSNDHVEVMIDPNFTQNRYFHYMVGINGAIYDSARSEGGFVGDQKWISGMTSAVDIQDEYWTAEMKLPYFSMDINASPATWGFNFCRAAWAQPSAEECTVTSNGSFHSAGSFLPVNGIDIALDKYSWQISVPKVEVMQLGDSLAVNVSVPVSNAIDQKKDILVDMIMNGGELGIAGGYIVEKFEPREKRNIVFRDIKLKNPGKYQVVVDIMDPESRLLYKRSQYPVTIEFIPISISLKKPWYRNAIFESQELKEVEYEVICRKDASAPVRTGIRELAGKTIVEKTAKSGSIVKFPVSGLPYGKMEIFAEVNGETITEPLRKLPYRKGEVWRDQDGIWRVEKRKFFPVFNWGSAHIEGTVARVHSDGKRKDLLRVDGALMWSGTPTHKYLRMERITPEAEKIIRERVRLIDSWGDNLFAYYLCDEPEISGVRASVLTHFANIMRDEDPYHPIIVSNDTVSGVLDFLKAAEINGLHPYPNPVKGVSRPDFARIVTFMSQAVAVSKANNNAQTITFLQQSFNYGDCGSRNSRIPTYDEIRTQLLLTFTLGGNGVEFFNFTNCHYPELYVGLPDIAQEFTDILTPAMTSPDFPGAVSSNPNVAVRVKKVGEHYWIFASGLTTKSEKASITVPGLKNGKLQVIREGRRVEVSNGAFQDVFNNYDSRVYTTDLRDFGKPTIYEVAAKIDALNEARRKPGNLAFQKEEDDGIKLTSNSNVWGSRTPSATLWHVTDGITSGVTPRSPQGGEGFMPYAAKKDEVPVWIALDFQKEVTAGRIAVYGAENSLADYDVQVLAGGKWETVGSVKDSKDNFAEFKFPPRKITAVKVNVTKINYIERFKMSQARIHEIEVYEK